MLAYSANTVADCAVEPEALAGGVGQQVPARLVKASIHLARGDPRLAGSALHELGHALGFQGHVRRGRSVMLGSTDSIRRAGERVLAGEPLHDAALEALYAVPSGTLLRRLSLPPGRTEGIDRLLRLAASKGWIGPLVRVGDHEGLVSWYEGPGRSVSVEIRNLNQALRDPGRLTLSPSTRARRLLGEAP
jgi:hypothetical protein